MDYIVFLSLPFAAIPLYLLYIEGNKQALQKKHLNLLRFLFLPFAAYYSAIILFLLIIAGNPDSPLLWLVIIFGYSAPTALGAYAVIYAVIATVIMKRCRKSALDQPM
ncbi:hypothetical protein [Polycladidibacter hongkongensis]|uniref:hypothetical protein n=1 Tax=Polycladidibacter hongkongensis TaxID=1647556 RepID=UPI0008354364|nr:hypothetical protein [Pseudovibrio hongkongensis]